VPKGGRDRRVPMTKRLAALLAANRHLRGARVLYRDDGEPVARATVSRWMKKAQTRAGLPITGALHILVPGGEGRGHQPAGHAERPAFWRHPGDGLRDAGKGRWVRKGEGPGIVEVSLLIPGPSIGEEYGT
jgi:hypothetical protein